MENVYIGFGVPASQQFARFDVLADSRSGVYPDWESPTRHVTDYIVGSQDFEVQIMHTGEGRITLDLDFETREAFRLFRTMLHQKRTLILYAGFTSHEGVIHTFDNRQYEYFADTLLLDIGRPANHVDGSVMCSATFVRAATGMGVML